MVEHEAFTLSLSVCARVCDELSSREVLFTDLNTARVTSDWSVVSGISLIKNTEESIPHHFRHHSHFDAVKHQMWFIDWLPIHTGLAEVPINLNS